MSTSNFTNYLRFSPFFFFFAPPEAINKMFQQLIEFTCKMSNPLDKKKQLTDIGKPFKRYVKPNTHSRNDRFFFFNLNPKQGRNCLQIYYSLSFIFLILLLLLLLLLHPLFFPLLFSLSLEFLSSISWSDVDFISHSNRVLFIAMCLRLSARTDSVAQFNILSAAPKIKPKFLNFGLYGSLKNPFLVCCITLLATVVNFSHERTLLTTREHSNTEVY